MNPFTLPRYGLPDPARRRCRTSRVRGIPNLVGLLNFGIRDGVALMGSFTGPVLRPLLTSHLQSGDVPGLTSTPSPPLVGNLQDIRLLSVLQSG